jgi:hypothetical protein
MKEDRMDELFRDLARDTYNPPAEAPRDEMWGRIRAARKAGRLSSGDVALTDAGDPQAADTQADLIPFRRRIPRWAWRALPVAALLLLSFGLGRLSLVYQRPATPVATRQPLTKAPAGVPAKLQAPGESRTPGSLAAASPSEQRTPEAAAPVNPAFALNTARPRQPQPQPRSSMYRLAAAQTLGQAELLLTSFRADARQRGVVDPQLAQWAGDVLSSTRLLIDSPAGRDPKLRPLLEDLELVLVQIVQLRAAPDARPGDAELVDHALQERDILPRLRTAVPAGASAQT